MRIVPVAGRPQLTAADSVVRLANRGSSSKNVDWEFLASLVTVVDAQWLSYLGQSKRQEVAGSDLVQAVSMLQILGLADATPIAKVIEQASAKFFTADEPPLSGAVTLTHLAAALDAEVPETFYFASLDEDYRPAKFGMVVDCEASFELITPDAWGREHILHPQYSYESATCTSSQWESWIRSRKSRLTTFPALELIVREFGMRQLETFLKTRGSTPPETYHYRNRLSQIVDYDFPPELVKFWESKERTDPAIWSRLIASTLSGATHLWADRLAGSVFERSGSGHTRKAQCPSFTSAWIHRFSGKKCLPDTYGQICEPAELLMRSPDTEPLMGAERFVKAELDNELTKPLLKSLGVRDTPTGPQQLLSRIKALSASNQPPVQAVIRWYDAIDRVLARARPEDLALVQTTFRTERLCLTQENEWTTSTEVFLLPDEDIAPGAPTVHEAARSLSLWRRIGIDDHPSVDRMLEWLKSLESGCKMEPPVLRRVKQMLQRFPHQVWDQCAHWLSVDGTWSPVNQLRYQVSMQGLLKFSGFFPSFKAQTADLRGLDAGACERAPFDILEPLDRVVEYRKTSDGAGNEKLHKPWITKMGEVLQRIAISDPKSRELVWSQGERLAKTKWQTVSELRVAPYVAGVPVGEPTSAEAHWLETTLFVKNLAFSRLFNAIAQEIARPLGSGSFAEAVRACLDRTEDFIEEYFGANFDLVERTSAIAASEVAAPDISSSELRGSSTCLISSNQSTIEGASDIEVASLDELSIEQALPTNELQKTEPDFAGFEEVCHENTSAAHPARTRKRTHTVTLLEQFVALEGFTFDRIAGKYVHKNGNWLVRRSGDFGCEKYSDEGLLLQQYWISEQRLCGSGVIIPADVWELLSQHPSLTSVVVNDHDDRPLVLSGFELKRRVQADEIALFPAAFRFKLRDS